MRSKDRRRTFGELLERALRDEDFKLRPAGTTTDDPGLFAFLEGVISDLRAGRPPNKRDREPLQLLLESIAFKVRPGRDRESKEAEAVRIRAINDARAYKRRRIADGRSPAEADNDTWAKFKHDPVFVNMTERVFKERIRHRPRVRD
jgi:hypothetical protein